MGPPVIGALSDYLASGHLATYGLTPDACASLPGNTQCASGIETGLRWAMMIGVLGYLWAALHFLISARTLRRDWVA
jgi:hypothetical protein